MEELSDEILFEIILNLELEDILNFISINKNYYNLINNDYFWKQKISRDFSELNKSNINYTNPRKYYYKEYYWNKIRKEFPSAKLEKDSNPKLFYNKAKDEYHKFINEYYVSTYKMKLIKNRVFTKSTPPFDVISYSDADDFSFPYKLEGDISIINYQRLQYYIYQRERGSNILLDNSRGETVELGCCLDMMKSFKDKRFLLLKKNKQYFDLNPDELKILIKYGIINIISL